MHSSGIAQYALRLTSRRTDHALIITVGGDIDVDTVEPLQYALSAARSGPDADRTVVLDLSGVDFAGTSLINTLLRARSFLGAGRLRIADPSPGVVRLLRLAELDAYFAVDAGAVLAPAGATAG